jgi:hypothetical protein
MKLPPPSPVPFSGLHPRKYGRRRIVILQPEEQTGNRKNKTAWEA